MTLVSKAERKRAGHEMHRRFRLAFERLGISKQELASRLGVAQPTAVEWFSRDRLPDADVVARLPDVLGVNGHWLLTGDGTQAPPGHGKETTDQAMRLGAQSVIADLRRYVADLMERWDATARGKEAAALVRQRAKQGAGPPGQRRQPPRQKTG